MSLRVPNIDLPFFILFSLKSTQYIAMELLFYLSLPQLTFSGIYERSHLQGTLTVVSIVESSSLRIRRDCSLAFHPKQEPVPMPCASDGQAFPYGPVHCQGTPV